MFQTPVRFLLLCSLTCGAAIIGGSPPPLVADDGRTSVLVDEFDEPLALEWVIESKDDTKFSLAARPGELVIRTAYGCAHSGCDQLPRNSFFLKDLVPADHDFEVTLAISDFVPEDYWHQVSLLLHQSTDSYLKLCVERERGSKRNIVTVFQANENVRSNDHRAVVQLDGPLWLRMTRRGGESTLSYSNDGDQFLIVGTSEWKADQPDQPSRIGFAAYNGRNRSAAEIDVAFESFQLRTWPPTAEPEP